MYSLSYIVNGFTERDYIQQNLINPSQSTQTPN